MIMSDLNELNKQLRDENEALKLVVGNLANRFERYFADADKQDNDKGEDRVKPDFSALKKELDLNDELLNRQVATSQKKTPNPMYVSLLNELNENKELLNNK